MSTGSVVATAKPADGGEVPLRRVSGAAGAAAGPRPIVMAEETFSGVRERGVISLFMPPQVDTAEAPGLRAVEPLFVLLKPARVHLDRLIVVGRKRSPDPSTQSFSGFCMARLPRALTGIGSPRWAGSAGA